jgi:hypothetical protein
MTSRGRLLLCACAGVAALMLSAGQPAYAMCGGNIFATCPPPANAASAEAARLKREKRLADVQKKKRHYPLGKR